MAALEEEEWQAGQRLLELETSFASMEVGSAQFFPLLQQRRSTSTATGRLRCSVLLNAGGSRNAVPLQHHSNTSTFILLNKSTRLAVLVQVSTEDGSTSAAPAASSTHVSNVPAEPVDVENAPNIDAAAVAAANLWHLAHKYNNPSARAALARPVEFVPGAESWP